MKKIVLLPALFAALFFTSCTKDQVEPLQESAEKTEARLAINTVSNSLLTGIWCITTCTNNNTDFVSQYKTYCFRFASNNSIVAVEGEQTGLIGNWTVGYVDGKARVSLSFLNNTGFEVVSGSWTMMESSTAKKVIMQAVGDQKNLLTFEQQ